MEKKEILKKKTEIDAIFKNSKSFSVYPFYLKFLESSDGSTKTLFTIPKKKFKNASDRNRIKRQLKSIYDTHATYSGKHVVVIYSSDKKFDYSYLETKLKELFIKLV